MYFPYNSCVKPDARGEKSGVETKQYQAIVIAQRNKTRSEGLNRRRTDMFKAFHSRAFN